MTAIGCRGGINLLLTLLVLLATFGGARADGALHAAQVSWLPCRSEAELAQEFQLMRRQGFDTVILRVFHNRGDRFYPFVLPKADAGVYFTTSEAPVVADILTPLIPLARAAGLKVYAWANTLSTPLAGAADLRDRRYNLSSGAVEATDKLDPFHPEVRRRLARLFQDLARYDLDGILFQDDLMSRHVEGFSAAAISAYFRDDGKMPDPEGFYWNLKKMADGRVRVGTYSPEFRAWARWKCRSLLDLASALRHGARQVNPAVKVVVNLPYEILSNPSGALAWFSLDFDEVKKCDFDYLGLMLYHRQIARELDLPEDEAVSLVGSLAARGAGFMTSPSKLLIKLQAVDFDNLKPIPPAELKRVEKTLGSLPVGKAWFPYLGPDRF